MQSAIDVIAALHAIAEGTETVYLRSRALFDARATERSVVDLMATRELSHSCNLLTSRIAQLHRVVTGFDSEIAGSERGSVAELGLRAQTLAILLLLDELYEALQDDPFRYQELFTGRLRRIEDVVAFVCDSLARINHLWLCHRATRAHLYRSAIGRAQCDITALGADPDLAHFLRAGSSRTDAPRVKAACDQLADVLTIALTREPEPGLFLAALVLDSDQLLDLSHEGDLTPPRLPRKL